MACPLLDLPRESGDSIWSYALWSHNARIVDPFYLEENLMLSEDELTRFLEPLEPKHPPPADSDGLEVV
jgi:hypothetical protein